MADPLTHYTVVHEQDGSLQLENQSSDKSRNRERSPAERRTVAALLDRITREWIESRQGQTDNAGQERLHDRVEKTIGAISRHNPKRSGCVRQSVRRRYR